MNKEGLGKIKERRLRNQNESIIWRKVAIGLWVIIMILIIALFVTKEKKQEVIVIHVSDIDNSGTVPYTSLDQYIPDETVIRKFIKDFVYKLRYVSIDSEVVLENLQILYSYMQGNANKQVTNIINGHDVYKLSKTGIRMIPDISLLYRRVDNSNIWVVEWRELLYDTNGSFVEEKHYKGEIHVKYVKPQTIEQIKNNPIGLWVFDFVMEQVQIRDNKEDKK